MRGRAGAGALLYRDCHVIGREPVATLAFVRKSALRDWACWEWRPAQGPAPTHDGGSDRFRFVLLRMDVACDGTGGGIDRFVGFVLLEVVVPRMGTGRM
jgi:hypothetical protein